MKLKRITFTGIDDTVNTSDLLRLIAVYPNVELGILITSGLFINESKPRYPSLARIKEFLEELPKKNLALHLCGSWSKGFFIGNLDAVQPLIRKVSRVQVNFHARHIKKYDIAMAAYGVLNQEIDEVILQANHHNMPMIENFLSMPCSHKFTALYDESGGAGIETDFSMLSDKILWGFAGGMSPDNIGRKLEGLNDMLPEKYVTWVDMETHIRDSKDCFSVEKCMQVMEGAKKYVV